MYSGGGQSSEEEVDRVSSSPHPTVRQHPLPSQDPRVRMLAHKSATPPRVGQVGEGGVGGTGDRARLREIGRDYARLGEIAGDWARSREIFLRVVNLL